jgi:hypothetical protein
MTLTTKKKISYHSIGSPGFALRQSAPSGLFRETQAVLGYGA